jgi:UDP-2-acetamido-3-amino-2,3-dideoxy-glucuronate N-acetyltransferase
VEHITVRHGASVGTGAIVLPGVTIGCFAMVGAGALVTRDVPDFGLVVGLPARLASYVCRCGQRLEAATDGSWECYSCQRRYESAHDAVSNTAGFGLRPVDDS